MSKRKDGAEGSAYWDWAAKHSRGTDDGRMFEPTDANPDQLTEEDVLIKKSPLTDEEEECVAAYYQALSRGVLKRLPERERQVWKMRFYDWLSETEISRELGIHVSAVQVLMKRATDKIKVAIERQRKKRARLDGNYANNGFKKDVEVVGEAPTDKEFGERLEKSEAEIDDFLKKHPELGKNI